jgi:AhpD family alkylhydroperoxidase
VYRSPTIGPRLRAIAALATARAHDCEYCISHMTASGLKAGMTFQELSCVAPGRMSDAREATVVEFADALTRNSAGVTDALLERMREYFTEPELVNLTVVVGLYALTGRFLKAMRIDVDKELLSVSPDSGVKAKDDDASVGLMGLRPGGLT